MSSFALLECNIFLCQDENKSEASQNRQRIQVMRGHLQGNQSKQNRQRLQSELEKQILITYRQSLVHKARPMPSYKFFVPKRNLKPLTVPLSPNLTAKRKQLSQKNASVNSPFFLLHTKPDLSDLEVAKMSPDTEGGSFLDYSCKSEDLRPIERDSITINDGSISDDETKEEMQ